MLNSYNNQYRTHGRQNHIISASDGLTQGAFSPEQVQQLIHEPMLRPQDRPEFIKVGNRLIKEPNDFYLQEYFGQLLGDRLLKVNEVNDPFYPNYPPKGSLLTTEPAICAGTMLTGDRLFKPLNGGSGCAITGLPGMGKSTLVMEHTVQEVLAGALAIVWDIKGTWKKLLYFPLLIGKVIILSVIQFIWALIYAPPGCSQNEWHNRFTKVISQSYGRISSQRILRQIIQELSEVCPPNCAPSVNMIIDRLKTLHAKSSRDRDVISGLLWVFVDITNHFPGCFDDYIYSDFPLKLIEKPGRLIIIEDNGLPAIHRNFVINLLWEYTHTYRLRNSNARNFDIHQVLEDSTPILDHANDLATPGGVSLLAQNLNLGRELRIKVKAICHSLGQISPKILPNIDSYFICSLRGDNLTLAQQILGVTHEQAELLRVNPLGTACALIPSVWPLPVMINFPPLPENFE